MTELHRILIVTPTLGESEFLRDAVASVAAQSLNVRHVLAVPATKVALLQKRFPQTHVVPDAGKAGGIYGALNAAIGAAPNQWDWFSYINDDDRLLPGFAATVSRHVRAGRPESVIYGDVDLIDRHDRILSQVTVERNPAWIPALLQQGISPLMQQGMVIRRETIRRLGGFNTRYRLCADLDFWLRALVAKAGFRHYPVRVAQFRVRGGQLSGDTLLTEQEQTDIVQRHLPLPVPASKKQLARLRYRLSNLPRYFARVRSRGWRTSYQVLQDESTRR